RLHAKAVDADAFLAAGCHERLKKREVLPQSGAFLGKQFHLLGEVTIVRPLDLHLSLGRRDFSTQFPDLGFALVDLLIEPGERARRLALTEASQLHAEIV